MENRLFVICDGKEISYGLSLMHLLKFEGESGIYYSSIGEQINSDIYSQKAYLHEAVNAKAIKIFINAKPGETDINIFDEFGMKIYKEYDSFFFDVTPDFITKNNYGDFIGFANEQRDKYLINEKVYVDIVQKENQEWLPGKFIIINKEGILKKNSKNITKQQFDCMALVFINELLFGYLIDLGKE